MTHIQSFMRVSAMLLDYLETIPVQPPRQWKDDETRKITKDRSKIKAARKQNRRNK